MSKKELLLSDYFQYRCRQRGFDVAEAETIVRFSSERYLDVETRRKVVIGRHKGQLVMIPYEETAHSLKPVTIHVTDRRQIRFRLNMGRLIHE